MFKLIWLEVKHYFCGRENPPPTLRKIGYTLSAYTLTGEKEDITVVEHFNIFCIHIARPQEITHEGCVVQKLWFVPYPLFTMLLTQQRFSLKRQCHESPSGFFHESVSPKPLRAILIFFRKFAEIFAAQGASPVSLTPVANEKKSSNWKKFNYFVWTPLGSRVNIYVNFCLQVHFKYLQPDIFPIICHRCRW